MVGFYTMQRGSQTTDEKYVRRAIRPLLFEDRILAVEQKFFCDRTTEKTVTLTVKDNQQTQKTVSNSTVKLSCQYPLSAAYDLTIHDMNNQENNTWKFIKTNETECEADGCTNKEYENGTIIPRLYEAELWARKDEEIRFHIKFSKGSHVNFTWMFEEDLGAQFPHVEVKDEQCEIMKAPAGGGIDDVIADISTAGVSWDGVGGAGKLCKFPFRFKKILYYACTNFSDNATAAGLGSPQEPITVCATESDQNFNPTTMGFCNTEFRCPIQCKSRSYIIYIII